MGRYLGAKKGQKKGTWKIDSGVSWGSWTEWEGTVGKSTPVSQGEQYAKNKPGHRLAPFKFKLTRINWQQC